MSWSHFSSTRLLVSRDIRVKTTTYQLRDPHASAGRLLQDQPQHQEQRFDRYDFACVALVGAAGHIVLLVLHILGCRMYHPGGIGAVAGDSLVALAAHSLCRHIHHRIAAETGEYAGLSLGSGTSICPRLGPILRSRVLEVAAAHCWIVAGTVAVVHHNLPGSGSENPGV